MGPYLSTPNTVKESINGKSRRLSYGASSMQGWRQTQEDAHNCILDYDTDPITSFFAIYDGHGGSEVAKYCALHLPQFIKNMELYQKSDITSVLQAAFMDFDLTLKEKDVIQKLKILAGTYTENIAEEMEAEKHETALLLEEATMPLDKVLSNYGDLLSSGDSSNDTRSCSTSRITTDSSHHTETDTKTQSENQRSNCASLHNVDVKMCNEHGEGTLADTRRNCEASSQAANAVSDWSVDDVDNSSRHDDHGTSSPLNKNDECQETKDNAQLCGTSSLSGFSKGDTNCNESSHANKTKSFEDTDRAPQNPDSAYSFSESVNDSSLLMKEPMVCSTPLVSRDVTQPSEKSASLAEVSCEPSCSEPKPKSLHSSIFPEDLNSDDDSDDTDEKIDPDKLTSESSTSDSEVNHDDRDAEEGDDGVMWEDCSDEEDQDEEEDDGNDGFIPFSDMRFTELDEHGADSGCTVLVAMLLASRLVVANVGDCRCVLCHDGQAVDLSIDHKPEDEAERKRIEEAGGKVTRDGRVNGGLNLSRAIGDHSYKNNKVVSHKDQMISAFPDVQSAELTEADSFFILACDGIWNVMSSQEAVDFVIQHVKNDPSLYFTPSKICEEMFSFCLAPDTTGDGTGCDNMTCIIVFLSDKPPTFDSPTPAFDESSRTFTVTDECNQSDNRVNIAVDTESENVTSISNNKSPTLERSVNGENNFPVCDQIQTDKSQTTGVSHDAVHETDSLTQKRNITETNDTELQLKIPKTDMDIDAP